MKIHVMLRDPFGTIIGEGMITTYPDTFDIPMAKTDISFEDMQSQMRGAYVQTITPIPYLIYVNPLEEVKDGTTRESCPEFVDT